MRYFALLLTLSLFPLLSLGIDIKKDGLYYNILSTPDSTIALFAIDDSLLYKDVVIPAKVEGWTVTKLLASSFRNRQVKSIFIPPTISQIAMDCFENAGSRDIKISDLEAFCNIESADYNSYGNAASPFWASGNLYLNDELVKDLIIPESITSFRGYYLFSGCRLKTLKASSLSNISSGTFDCCTLEFVDLSEIDELSIGSYCFGRNRYLSDVKWPKYVSSIGREAFKDCKLETLDINVGFIGSKAFLNNKLTTIKLGSKLNGIGSAAFSGNKNLISIYIESVTPPNINEDAFDIGHFMSATLFVPSQSIDEYRTAKGWKDFMNIEPYDFSSDIINVYSNVGETAVYSIKGERIHYIRSKQQINSLPKGVYIINGKKVCVK